MDTSKLKRRNLRVAAISFTGAAVMIGGAFALVPYYDAFCRAIGIGGDPQIVTENTTTAIDRPVTVRFDANTDPQLPWKFEALQKSVTLNLGETETVFYRATNMADHPTTGTATFNVTPDKSGQYFSKLECFCFQEQTLEFLCRSGTGQQRSDQKHQYHHAVLHFLPLAERRAGGKRDGRPGQRQSSGDNHARGLGCRAVT
jgi:cytochrome c oxidase assembly protein Cox11